MGKLFKLYNQNRYLIWIIILVIIAIIVLIQIVDAFVSNKKNIEEDTNKSGVNNTSINNNIDENYSVITGNEVKKEVAQVIDQFINYCNNKEIEKAYKMLSKECKETLYPTLDEFTKKYYKKLFMGNVTYLYQSWITNDNYYTYKVDFVEDMLATGKAATTSITDYYTIVKNNDKYELNINKFIGIQDINKTQTKDNIKITAKRKRIYMDYEIYELKLENKSQKNIILDSLKETNTVYLEDENQQKYYWHNYEVLEEDISVRKAQTTNLDIKFNKTYQVKRESIKLVFSDIVLDNKDIIKIEIPLLQKEVK